MSATCPGCGYSWSGTRPEHCPECHETFGGTVAGDLHRVGDYGLPKVTPGARRVCLTPTEMGEAGMSPNAAGHWSVTEARERALRYRREARGQR